MNKKLSQLSEKVTSLSADDLLLVSTGGVSKSIKASTLEAPLKAYADQKKSEVISELSSLDSALSSEVTNRQTADTNTLNSAKSYTDSEISSEVSARNSADTTTLNSAKSYTESKLMDFAAIIATEEVTRLAADTALSTSLSQEVSNRTAADVTTLNSAKSYADSKVWPFWAALATEEVTRLAADTALSTSLTEEVNTRIAADVTTLNSAKSYTESKLMDFAAIIATEEVTRLAADVTTLNSAKSYADSIVATSGLIPVGVIQIYAGSSAPSGWLLCDGSAVSRSTYSALFTLIGVSYGSGNGSTTFNIPSPDTNANLRLIIKV